MSFDAIRWALAQSVPKSSAKFVLVAMADCVNAEDAPDMLCWPSYRLLAQRTGQDLKTVEAGVKRLRDLGFIEDSGERQGRTGSVVVYRLSDTKNGVALPRPEPRFRSASNVKSSEPKAAEHSNNVATSNPVFGVTAEIASDPVFPRSDPVFPDKRPRFSDEATPKTGGGISKGIRNGTSKEPGNGNAMPQIDGVPESLVNDWLKVRKDKRAGPITGTVIRGLEREAGKAGVTVADAVTFCCEAGWQGFNAGWYLERMAKGQPRRTITQPDDRKSRQLQTAALMTGASQHQQENFDVESHIVATRKLA